jgi:hypothetical protein
MIGVRGGGAGRGWPVGLGVLLVCTAGAARAQELEPRAYAANPIGVTFAGVALSHSTGAVVLDAASPFRDVDARSNVVVLAAGHTFGLFGRTASVGLGLPYAWATVTGRLAEATSTADRAGLGDARLRLALSLFGGRAMWLPEFVRRAPSTMLGTSLTVVVPSGQYFPDKLVNVGTNRWALKPEIGLSHPAGRWTLELYGGSWFFAENGSGYPGNSTHAQRPLLSLQSHVGYTLRPRLWGAVDATYYEGGRVVTDDVPAPDRQSNARLGLTASLPAWSGSSLKLAWAMGAITRVGGNFQTWSVGWQTASIHVPRPAASSR